MKRFLKKLLYVPKYEKTTDVPLARLLMPSVVAVVLCVVCLCGMTFAWFSARVSIPNQTLTAANYAITATVVAAGSGENVADVSVLQGSDGTYTLTAGQAYRVTLTNSGTATSGYCLVTLGDNKYCTGTITGTSYILNVTPGSNCAASFVGMWGTPDSSITKITDNTITEATAQSDPVAGADGNSITLPSEDGSESGDTATTPVNSEPVVTEPAVTEPQEGSSPASGESSGESEPSGGSESSTAPSTGDSEPPTEPPTEPSTEPPTEPPAGESGSDPYPSTEVSEA